MKRILPVLFACFLFLALPLSVCADTNEGLTQFPEVTSSGTSDTDLQTVTGGTTASGEKDPGTYGTAANGYAYTAPTVSDQTQRVYDFAGLLTPTEITDLTAYLITVETSRKCTVVAVTTQNTADDPNGGTAVTRAYAEDFYDANASGFQEDAWVMCIDMNNRVIYTVGHGRFAKEKYVNFTQRVYNDVLSDASQGDYAKVIHTYAHDVYTLDNWANAMIPTPLSLLVSAAIAGIACFILVLNHQKKEPVNNARIAVRTLHAEQVGHNAVFLGTTRQSRRVPRDNGGGGGGGGFSGGMSVGGGGGSFSGGGGHF